MSELHHQAVPEQNGACRAGLSPRAWCLALLCICLALTALPAWSGQRPWTLERYRHVAWTGKNGAPTGVAALAQTTDGYLWIGTDHGLYHFDGIRFERFEPAAGETLQSEVVSALFASRDGGLWVGYEAGGVSLLKDGHLSHYKPRALGHSMVIGLAQDREGNIWEWGEGGPGATLYEFSQGRWQPMSTGNGLDGHAVTTLHIARDGSFWAGTTDGLYYKPADSKAFRALANEGYVGSVAQAPDGSMWVAKLRGSIQRWTVSGGTPVVGEGTISTSSTGVIAFDELGGLWIGGLGDGLRHLATATPTTQNLDGLASGVQLFDASKGLSNDYVWPLLEDREGNVWLGTSAGVDRFSRSNFTPAPFPSGTHDFALAPGADGTLWTGSSSKPVMQLAGGKVNSFDVPPFTLAAWGDGSGTVLIGGQSGIWRMTPAGAEHVATLPLSGRHLVAAIAEDRHGTLWISITGRQGGLFSWANGQWKRWPSDDHPRAEFVDRDGRLWLGYPNGKLIIRDGVKTTTLGKAAGVTGNINVMQENLGHVWAGGSDGLGYLVHGQLRKIVLAGGASLQNVTGLVATPSGDFWVHTLDGVYLLSASELKQSEADPVHRVPFRKFDTLDGLPGAPALQIPLPSAVRGSDGRIWFATSNGVVWVDPTQLISNRRAPPISIDSIQADGKTYHPRDGLVLPANTRNIKVRFAALGLTVPERVLVKVRMSGVDKDWVDVGPSREAGYTNLGPGRYRLQVIAANEDGVWNRVGSTVAFGIAPTFFQTSWFIALCVVGALLLAWLGFIRRLRYERRLVANRIAARHAERERIARELHDTLLQGFQGLLMRVQVWVGDRDLSAARRLEMDRAIDQTQDLLSQGRDRILALREDAEETRELAPELRDFCAGFAATHPTHISVIDGIPAVLLPSCVAEEVLAIAHEAIVNALVHAKASMIEVELKRVGGALQVTARDDGCGIAPVILTAGGRNGHWGLIGMRERAQRIGAEFSVISDAGKGTQIVLTVPAVTHGQHPGRVWAHHAGTERKILPLSLGPLMSSAEKRGAKPR